MSFPECSESFCTAAYWAARYKALRGAFVIWRRLEREKTRQLKKNIQRLHAAAHALRGGNSEAFFTLKNILHQMDNEAGD